VDRGGLWHRDLVVGQSAVMARDPSRLAPPPPPPHLVTLRCTSAEAELIVRALRTTSAVQPAAAHRLADVLAAEAAISGRPRPR
jgi:hypothetical protein